MLDSLTAILLVAATGLFMAAGLRHNRRGQGSLDAYLVARHRYGASTGAATLLASTFGAWLLFSPAEAATWGGLVALLGYGAGAAAPRLAMIPLGLRMRRQMPNGRSLVEYVRVRYGEGPYILILLVMVAYLVVALAAEATATATLIGAVSDLPAWLPAGVTLLASLIYTSVGGLGASIGTDRQQMAVIVPFLLVLIGVGAYVALGGGALTADFTAEGLTVFGGWSAAETAGALFLAILFTGLLHQGSWQRVFAMQDDRAVRRSMSSAAVIAAPVIILVGAFGILHGALDLDRPSAAVIEVVGTALPAWALSLTAILGVALVLSSMDTTLNAMGSLAVVAARTARPQWSRRRLIRLSTGVGAGAALIALAVAMQGWSVLYLFLCADLLCAAAAVPVFAGLYLPSYSARLATLSGAAGLVAGLALFPGPSMSGGSLFGAFALAAGVPLLLLPLSRFSAQRFDGTRLTAEVAPYQD